MGEDRGQKGRREEGKKGKGEVSGEENCKKQEELDVDVEEEEELQPRSEGEDVNMRRYYFLLLRAAKEGEGLIGSGNDDAGI
jgi:hypothetical protein